MNLAKAIRSSELSYAAVLIVGTLALRGLMLEYTELIDPTEARYASVAQEMAFSGDWLTPKLPMPEGITAYVSKPPLHYWLTAISYTLFGVDEWTSRLPSLIAAVIILLAVFVFAQRSFDTPTAMIGALITLSSGLFFLLSGACVTDVTFTALNTLSLLTAYHFISRVDAPRHYIWWSAIFCGLAFLSRGPVSIVLLALPFLLWSVKQRNFCWIRRVPWLSCIAVVLIINIPWFVLLERANPGALKYFFWNENVARYLYHDYGDKFGVGHAHTPGVSWIMALMAFCPWTLLLLTALFRSDVRAWISLSKLNERNSFLWCWALSAPLFFSLAVNLHPNYLLPSMAPLGLLGARLVLRLLDQGTFSAPDKWWFWTCVCALALWSTVGVVGAYLRFELWAVTISLAVCALFFVFLFILRGVSTPVGIFTLCASVIISTYFVSIAAISPYISERRSAKPLLKALASSGLDPHRTLSVGLFSRNSFSPYWIAKAWNNELSRQVLVGYVAPEALRESNVNYLLVKTRTEDIPKIVFERFKMMGQSGDWMLFKRKRRPSRGRMAVQIPAPPKEYCCA